MLLLYYLSLWLYTVLIRLLAPWNQRAKLFLRERQQIFERLERDLKTRDGQLIWFHGASLGEFEQARPVMERLRKEKPEVKLLLTFFSPSGYLHCKDKAPVDYVHYLPMDSPTNAERFLKIVQPDLAVFVKYDFWYYYLTNLKSQNIPTLLISGIFRPNQFYFKPIGKFFLPALKSITHYFLQNEASGELLLKTGIDNFTVAGDTRFDRVLEIAQNSEPLPLIESFKQEAKIMVLGSVWPSDMEHLWSLVKAQKPDWKFIIAPHHVDEVSIKPYTELSGSICYSKIEGQDLAKHRVLIIDSMGLLSRVYRYADIAIVGGAFRGALHNVLEPAVYGIPVFYGAHPSNQKFVEANELQNAGGGFTFENFPQLEVQLDFLLNDGSAYDKAAEASRKYVQSHSGATDKVVEAILERISD